MQLCPALARLVRIDKDALTDFTPTAPAPMSDDEEDYVMYGDEEEDEEFAVEAALPFAGETWLRVVDELIIKPNLYG